MAQMIDDGLWAGTEASFQAVVRAEEALAQRMASGHSSDEDEDDEQPRLLDVQGQVAVISIKGPLVNSAAWWNELFGVTGYPEIRDALVAAANDDQVKHIVLDVDTGGGTVSGVADTAALIREISSKVKPITTFTDSNMMSAGYWLGCAADEVYCSKGAGVGSIGVIATHMEHSERLKAQGVGVTVVRSGKWKALANGVEKLSDEGKAQLQDAVDATDLIFTEHVGEMRGKSVEFVKSVMGQGRVFYGQSAADASLVDGLTTFDALMSKINEKLIDPLQETIDNRGKQSAGLRMVGAAGPEIITGGSQMAGKRKALTEQEIAALAAGGTVRADIASDEPNAQAEEVEATVDQEVEAQAEAEADPAAEADGESDEKVATNSDVTKVLSAQLKEAQEAVLAARIALAKAEEKRDEMSAVVDPLRAIAVKAINNMRVALGGSALDMGSASASQVLAEYESISENFMKRMKVGGVAAVDAGNPDAKGERPASAFAQARVTAVRLKK